MLRGGNYALALYTLDSCSRSSALKVRVRAEAFPVAPTSWHATEGAHGRAQDNMDALEAGFETVELSTFLPDIGVSSNCVAVKVSRAWQNKHQFLIPGSPGSQAGGPRRSMVGETKSKGTILETERRKLSRYRSSVSCERISSQPVNPTNSTNWTR